MIMKLAQLPLRERVGLLAAIGFMVLLVADAFVLKPVIRHLDGLDTSIASAQAELQRSRGVLRYAESVNQQYMAVKDLLGVSGPESETIEVFKNELDELALAHRVQIRSMRHLNPEETDHLLTYVIDFGDYEADTADLLRFLNAIHRAPGLVRVRQLAMASQSAHARVTGSISVTRVMTRMLPAGEQL